MKPQKLYRLVIPWIDTNVRDRPFAVWEVAAGTGATRPTVRYVLKQLQECKLVAFNERAFAARYWTTTPRWTTGGLVCETYEVRGMLKRSLPIRKEA